MADPDQTAVAAALAAKRVTAEAVLDNIEAGLRHVSWFLSPHLREPFRNGLPRLR